MCMYLSKNKSQVEIVLLVTPFSCLQKSGDEGSTIDFYQMHSYAWNDQYSSTSPLMLARNMYGNDDKPLVIGEFSQSGGDGRDITELIHHGYTYGYRWV